MGVRATLFGFTLLIRCKMSVLSQLAVWSGFGTVRFVSVSAEERVKMYGNVWKHRRDVRMTLNTVGCV